MGSRPGLPWAGALAALLPTPPRPGTALSPALLDPAKLDAGVGWAEVAFCSWGSAASRATPWGSQGLGLSREERG